MSAKLRDHRAAKSRRTFIRTVGAGLLAAATAPLIGNSEAQARAECDRVRCVPEVIVRFAGEIWLYERCYDTVTGAYCYTIPHFLGFC
jgi:hypothetical protein